MHASLRSFRITLIIVLLLAASAGALYSSYQSIPARVAIPLIAAVLAEIACYILPGSEAARKALEMRFPRAALAVVLTLSAIAPYCIYAIPTEQFRWPALALLTAIAIAVSFWFVLLPTRPAGNVAFIAIIAAIVLSKAFSRIYLSPVPKLRLEFLGQLMLIRTGILAVLSIGRLHVEGGFGFLPRRREWVVGLRHFALLAPLAAALALALGVAKFDPRGGALLPLIAIGTFLGMLWVVALSEEFFFRGLLQQWLARWAANRWAGIALTAVLFGLVHLPFRGFPNWRFALVAAVAGLFYGHAAMEAGSFRAAMVAHALINSLWRTLFR